MFGINEVDVDQLDDLIAQGEDILLIDVRTPAEIAQGAIPGAEHLPLHLLPVHISQIPSDKKIVFYCRTGARSAQACMFAANQGTSNVWNLRGGIMAWAREGKAVA